MVTTKKKWCCGTGEIVVHYCDICGRAYSDLEDAMECENACKRLEKEKKQS